MVTMYANLLGTYKQIKLLINPFRTEDSLAWQRLQEILETPEDTLRVKLCTSSTAWNTGESLRLPSSPGVANFAEYSNTNSQEFAENERFRPFMLSEVVSFDDIFEGNTSCCLLLDIAEAFVWVKCKICSNFILNKHFLKFQIVGKKCLKRPNCFFTFHSRVGEQGAQIFNLSAIFPHNPFFVCR